MHRKCYANISNTWYYNIPLWFNSKNNFDLRKVWFQKDTIWVKDIQNENGDMVSITDLTDIGLQINFLH